MSIWNKLNRDINQLSQQEKQREDTYDAAERLLDKCNSIIKSDIIVNPNNTYPRLTLTVDIYRFDIDLRTLKRIIHKAIDTNTDHKITSMILTIENDFDEYDDIIDTLNSIPQLSIHNQYEKATNETFKLLQQFIINFHDKIKMLEEHTDAEISNAMLHAMTDDQTSTDNAKKLTDNSDQQMKHIEALKQKHQQAIKFHQDIQNYLNGKKDN